MTDNNLILVINCGSSSLKFALFEALSSKHDPASAENVSLLAEGLAGGLGGRKATLTLKLNDKRAEESININPQTTPAHGVVLKRIIAILEKNYPLTTHLSGVGHRVVHGGERFSASTLVDNDVLEQIDACTPLAPLHNPANLLGIQLLQEQFPGVPQVAVFDTAFHQTMPEHAYIYGLPYQLYKEHGLRRYGFHGSSHRYVAQRAQEFLGIGPDDGNFVIAHLGNGASVCAVKDGKSVDTSMGLTPLEGLVMGTRSGDIDPGIFDFLIKKGYDTEEINNMLNRESGLKGISKLSNDMRTLISSAEQGHVNSKLAIEIFCYRLAKYIAAMMVPLGSLDALIFTGGIGENAALVRSKTIDHLKVFGFKEAPVARRDCAFEDIAELHEEKSRQVLVINTDEEKMIANDTFALVTQK